MSGVNLLYARYQLRDLDLAESFMADFGLIVASRSTDKLYMRGSGVFPFVYEAVRGESDKFLGVGFEVSSAEDLDRLANLPGSSAVETVTDPGGGRRVRMRTPDGVEIDAVNSFTSSERLKGRDIISLNTSVIKHRVNAPVRITRDIAVVNKFGHFVLHVSDHDATVAWFKDRLGMIASDYMASPDTPNEPYGTFLRFDMGDAFVDHHCLFILGTPDPGIHHISFELDDIDAIMASHDYLHDCGHIPDVGVGRHLMGSQIFDYWRDPFGFRVEHYSDGDVVNNWHKPSTFTGTAEETTQWGAEPPSEFFQ